MVRKINESCSVTFMTRVFDEDFFEFCGII